MPTSIYLGGKGETRAKMGDNSKTSCTVINGLCIKAFIFAEPKP